MALSNGGSPAHVCLSADIGDMHVLPRAGKLPARPKGDAQLCVIICLISGSPVVVENLIQSSTVLRQVEGPDEVHVLMLCSATNKTVTGSNALRKLMQEGIAVTSLTEKK